jgi:hypothetical protein
MLRVESRFGIGRTGLLAQRPSRTCTGLLVKALLACALTMVGWTGVMACPPGYYEKVIGVKSKKPRIKLTFKSVCIPNSNVVIGQLTALETGPVLAGWIRESRDSAFGQSQPIPDDIREDLEGYIDDWVMDRARFKVGDNGVANLGRLINKYGDINAITLDDVIVFHDQAAADSPAVWAHELMHVKQYKEFGVLKFAIEYVSNYRKLEDPAYKQGGGYVAFAVQQSQRLTNQYQNLRPADDSYQILPPSDMK